MSKLDARLALLVAVLLGCFIAWSGVMYATGATAVTHPRHYSYIHWYAWLAMALVPTVGALVFIAVRVSFPARHGSGK